MAYSEDVNVNLNVLTGTMSGVTAIMGGMSALTSSFGAMGTEAANAFGVLDGLVVSSTLLITTFAAESAKAFGEFEQGMKIVQTVSGQSGYAIQELSNQANEMSIAYRTAIGDITEGLQTLGRAGLNSATTQLEVLESGLQTAKLEGRNLNGVLEEIIQNTAMLGGDLKSVDFGEQAANLNSLMVGTSMTAPINSHDISQTLQYAGGTAAAAGANLENQDKLDDLMGTIAAFAQKGVKGSMAGTALRAFFTKPASQDKSVTEGLSMIGLTPDQLWEDGGESMKKVSDQIGLIKRQMDSLNMSTMDQIEVWGKIVGPKMGQQMMKLDSSSIKDLTRDIEGAKNSEELAQQTLYTFNQRLSEMGQLKDAAFRGFGEKIVTFLNPAMSAINWILDALRNPIVNTAVFAALGSFVSIGIRKIYGMIQVVYNQIMGLVRDVVAGVQQITASASGSSTGFNQATASVEALNVKLAQSNSELAMMQARFMKLGTSATGSAVMPLGIVGPNGKVPANMIGHAEQNVFRGNGILGTRGGYYDPSETKKLEETYRKEIAAKNAENQAIRDKYSGVNARGVMQYHDPKTGRLMKEADFNKAYPIMAKEQIDKNVKSALASGEAKIHSSLMSMTQKEFKAFMGDLRASSKRLMNPENYRNADGSWNNKLYKQDQLKAFNYARQKEFMRNAAQEGNAHINKVGGQTFVRAFKLDTPKERMYEVERTLQKQSQLKQFEQQRANVINQQKALAQGRGQGFSTKAQQLTTQRLNAYSNALKSGAQRVRSASNTIYTGFQKVTGQFKLNSAAMEESLKASIVGIEKQLETVPMTFEEALIQIQEELGVSAAELNVMLTETSGEFAILHERLIQLGLTTVEGEVATAAHTGAVLADVSATEMSTLAKIKEAGLGALKSITGFMGGPFMAGMMAFTIGIQAFQNWQQGWQESMQKASDKLSEAADRMSEASDKIKELYSSENNNMTEADLEKANAQQYASMYDAFYTGTADRGSLGEATFDSDVDMKGTTDEETGEYSPLTAEEIEERNENVKEITLAKDENVQALKENTMELMSATKAYADAQQDQADTFSDGFWGMDGQFSDFTDQLGEWQEEIWNSGAWLSLSGGDAREGFLDKNSPVLTGSQKDSNYAGSTEFGAILAANAYRFDDESAATDEERFLPSLQQFFGSDYDRIIGLLNSMDNKMSTKYGTDLSGKNALYAHMNNMAGMDDKTMALAQMSLKNNKEDYQMLGKQMYRYEQSRGITSGRTAYGDAQYIRQARQAQRKGDTKGYEKAMKKLGKDKLTVQDKNLDNTIKKIMATTNNKLSYQNVLAMGQLQQLQDMQQIAQEQVAPGIMQTVEGVYNNVSATGVAGANAGSAANGAVSAANNAALIANFLGAQAQETAEHAAYMEYSRTSEKDLREKGIESGMDETKFRQKLADLSDTSMSSFRENVIKGIAGSGWSVNNPNDATPENIEKNSQRLYDKVMSGKDPNASYQDILNTVTVPLVNYAQGAVMAAYDQSNIGEYGGGNRSKGSGSGGGSGDGSDKDKDSGSKKERVDLVLCNKKEIPKLNVNLFKKPPNFTILNKNFKLRDIKINSQDKPKAIMNAIKNGIIETQKRMDPKIIQDEDAVYDPLAATDGSSTPSGTTKTTT